MRIPAIFLLAVAGVVGATAIVLATYAFFSPEMVEAGDRRVILFAATTQLFHSAALMAASWVTTKEQTAVASPAQVAGAAFILGIVLFSGSLHWSGFRGLAPDRNLIRAGCWFLAIGWLAIALAAGRILFCRKCRSRNDDHCRI
jgi:uncharacterized membrane protein YgdD (TMEM256/DUF423 family)